MASSPIETHRFVADDGVELAWHETGAGRAVVLIHGFVSNADTNWIRYGHAERIAARGFRVVMPDLRGHGDSAAPDDAALYPRDRLAADGLALVAHLGLSDYDLGGYSLGARTTVRMLVASAAPRRVVIAGMGLEGMLDTGKRAEHFRRIFTHLGEHPRGSPEWFAEAFLKTTGGDAGAMLRVIDTFADTSEEELRAIGRPALVLAGRDDDDNGSHEALAEMLPDARLAIVDGNHMNVVTKQPFGEAIADFLAG